MYFPRVDQYYLAPGRLQVPAPAIETIHALQDELDDIVIVEVPCEVMMTQGITGKIHL